MPGLGNPELQHGTRHTVSLSQEGTEVLVTCGAEPARELDEAGYLVVGRVVEGAEADGVLRTIEQAPVGADDEPLQAISVSACVTFAFTSSSSGGCSEFVLSRAAAAAASSKGDNAETSMATSAAVRTCDGQWGM